MNRAITDKVFSIPLDASLWLKFRIHWAYFWHKPPKMLMVNVWSPGRSKIETGLDNE